MTENDPTPAVGQIWRTRDKGEDWLITRNHQDARAAFYVEMLDDNGSRTGVTDALFGGEICSCADFVREAPVSPVELRTDA